MTLSWAAYENFAAVIAAQSLWFLVVSTGCVSTRRAIRNLAIGAVAGVPLGAFFDLVIGNYANIFHYVGLPVTGVFMALNGILSYGLAIATVLSFKRDELPAEPASPRHLAFIVASLAFALALLLPIEQFPAVAGMFLLGVLVLAFTEALCMSLGRRGYLVWAMRGSIAPVLRIWSFSVATGLIYETANYVFPLWVWANDFPSPLVNSVMIVLLGYFVLLLPIFAFGNAPGISTFDQFSRREQNLSKVQEGE